MKKIRFEFIEKIKRDFSCSGCDCIMQISVVDCDNGSSHYAC